MRLQPGRTLGPYEIVAFIGAGGMGEVYRARDTRLGRTVAVKVLPPDVSSLARARFEREARAIAALSHPNICAIHDVGSDEGDEYLVMEFLAGESLAQRLERGRLPLNLSLRYGVQIADALHQAHRAGITHRDLKPGNIMITPAGAKLLDFGLAQTVRPRTVSELAATQTQAAALTTDGVIVGTYPYMAPEQIQGHDVDSRTDIFALGVTLYEMVTGRRPFAGSSWSAVAAAILGEQPQPVRTLQPEAPALLERIILTALEKDREDRWQTAHDVARQLRWMIDSPSAEAGPAMAVAKRRFPRVVPLVAVAIAAALLTWLFARLVRQEPRVDQPLTRLEFSAPPGLVFQRALDANSFAISPDGKVLCFLASDGGETALYLRDLSSYEVRKVEGSESPAGPFWSPDSEWIAFAARGMLWKTKRSGDTPPVPLARIAIGGAVGAWHGRTILFSEAPDGRTGVFRVADTGGAAVPITETGAEWRHAWPYFLPDGRHFVHLAFSKTIDRDLVLASMDGTTKAILLKNVSAVRMSGTNQMMYVRDGKLLAQQFDAPGSRLVGEPVAVADHVWYQYPTAIAEFDAVPAGVVVYRTGTGNGRLSILDRTGTETKVLGDGGLFYSLDLSPDASRAAVSIWNRRTFLGDIWIYDLASGMGDRFTTEPGNEWAPLWSRDGRSLLYTSAQGGSLPHIVRRGVDGSAPEDVLARDSFRIPGAFSPDGQTLYFVERNAKTKTDIYRVTGGATPEAVLASEFAEHDPSVSPDGNWLAYASDVTGRQEIYVQQLATVGGRPRRLSSTEGGLPKWGRGAAAEVYYVAPDRQAVWVARSASGRWDDTRAESLFTTTSTIFDYAVLPSGGFIVAQESPGIRDSLFHVIQGWR